MDKKIIIKFILIIMLIIIIYQFDYCIYMFIKNDIENLPHSVDYVEHDMFDLAYKFTDTFFANIESGNYEDAYDMLHENCKRDLFDFDVQRFTKIIEDKYFNKQIGNKYYVIEETQIDNIHTDSSFHTYYKVNVLNESKALENSNNYYKSRVINVDVVKIDENFKLILEFEQDKEEEKNEDSKE